MTYFLATTCKRRPARAKSLGTFEDELNKLKDLAFGQGKSEEMQCLDQANAQVAGLDARIHALIRTWNPTGFYTPEEMDTAVRETLKLTSSASTIVGGAPLSTSDAVFSRNQAIKTIQQKATQSLSYTAAAQEARSKGIRAINAPGLKQWVVSSMLAASQALVTASVLECRMEWLASAIIKFQQVFDAVANVIKRIAGVVLRLAETALDVAEEIPDLAKKLAFVAKWGALAFAAVFVVKKIKEAR